MQLYCGPADERLITLLDISSPRSWMIINMFHVSIFSAHTYRDIHSSNPDRIWNISILKDFEKLEDQFRQWNDNVTSSFPYQTIQSSTGDYLNSTFTTSETGRHIYRGFWSASLWNKHRAARIILYQALLARLDAAKTCYTEVESETLGVI